ncbi:MAG: diaminopimelate epimerase [Desulfonauticus sp.]|nr:diaminopimelate epimerase [Desulfonauticus sp.]
MNKLQEMNIPFYKMQGSGNDFILFDLRDVSVSQDEMSVWAQKLCKRAFSIGADGLIFLENVEQDQVDFKWHFYNADGSRAEMCGNGSRCAALLAYLLELAPQKLCFLTDAGVIKAEIKGENLVKVQLTAPRDLKLNINLDLEAQRINVHYVNTGVPHVVFFVDDLKAVNVQEMGKQIRFHSLFAPEGTNVNFVQILNQDYILLRTYERGVEAETYACGTGASACVYVGNKLGLLAREVKVETSGREKLGIYLDGETVFLEGQTVLVYRGFLDKTLLEQI